MRFFLDTEFIESGPSRPIQLVSIALVAENGSAYYDVSSEYDAASANDWVKAHVLPHTDPCGDKQPLSKIAQRSREFVAALSPQGSPEFWGYYADYDWVVFCQTFGSMNRLPKGWPMYCRDLKQLCDSLGNPRLPNQSSAEHNALNDARWNLEVFRYLERIQKKDRK